MGKDVSWLFFPGNMKTGKPHFLTFLKVHSQNISHCFRRKLKETLSANLPRANRKNSVVCVIAKKGELIAMPLLFEFNSLPVNKASYFKHV
jgi:hypothetical protein